jgi:D-glycero-alpha-D-manno-heptose-7-phosphate kinase
MVISRTPLRMSLVGGGTDLPDFFERHGGGAVVSTAIDKYVHVIVSPRFEGDFRIGYSRTEIRERVDEIQHDLVREALRRTGLARGLDVLTLADVPGGGTGMGSSSAVTVGLLNAFHAYRGAHRSAEQLAAEACELEIDVLGKPIGLQDQYACAVGRFNLIEFLPGGVVKVEPIVAEPETFAALHRSLLLFYLGGARSADELLARQGNGVRNGDNTHALIGMRELAYRTRDLLADGDVDGVGRLLHDNWMLKRTVADGVTNDYIDQAYERALAGGALGGKLLGAGGGGFLLVHAPEHAQRNVRTALKDLREVPFRFSASGTQIRLVEQQW